MKNIKVYSAVLAAMMTIGFVSCDKIVVEPAEEFDGYPCTIFAGQDPVEDDTKTTIDGVTVYWEQGDAINVFAADGTSEGAFSASQGAKTGCQFNGFLQSPDDVPTYGLYPFDENATCTADGVITTTIPTEQDGTIRNALALATLGGSTGDVLSFKQACSVVKFTIPEGTTDIMSVAFVADNSSVIAGTFTVAASTRAMTPVSGKEAHTIFIRNADGTPLTPGVKYICMNQGTRPATLVFTKVDGGKRYAAAKYLTSRGYAGNRIKDFGTVRNLHWVEGALGGVFSINSTQKVLFAQGNVVYDASTSQWSFQKDQVTRPYVTASAAGSTGKFDYFRWNDADTPGVANARTAWSSDGDWAAEFGADWDLVDDTSLKFILETRSSKVKQVCSPFTYANMNGVVFYPDGYSGECLPASVQTAVTKTQLDAFEADGCLILMCGGYDGGDAKPASGSQGFYWTKTFLGSGKARSWQLSTTGSARGSNATNLGFNVRLYTHIN